MGKTRVPIVCSLMVPKGGNPVHHDVCTVPKGNFHRENPIQPQPWLVARQETTHPIQCRPPILFSVGHSVYLWVMTNRNMWC